MHQILTVAVSDDRTAPMSPLADEGALLVAARSDPEAFGVVYLRYLPRIYRYLRLRCAADADAADLAQEVFERALAALPKYRDKGLPFGAWLFAIARNLSADAARHSRRVEPLLPFGEDLVGSLGPEPQLLRREAIEEITALVATLDSDRRELLALRFGAGLTAREIAVVLGRSEGAVQQQFTRLLSMLKERFHDR